MAAPLEPYRLFTETHLKIKRQRAKGVEPTYVRMSQRQFDAAEAEIRAVSGGRQEIFGLPIVVTPIRKSEEDLDVVV